ncbi:MAG: 6-phosphogluconolactonase [Pseudomonadota bacterium]
MEFIEYPDAEMMMMDVADTLAGDLKSALLTHERVTFAVPGGTTPGPVFDTLSGVHLDWDRVYVMPTDERWVPGDHERSNARLIRDRLLAGASAAASFIPFYVEGETPDGAAERLSDEIATHLPVDVLLLGMGADMHTASLFPGAPGVAEALAAQAPAVAVVRPEGQPEVRLTLTAQVLNGALAKHILITGADKRAALERAAQAQPDEAPVQAVLRGAKVHWAE